MIDDATDKLDTRLLGRRLLGRPTGALVSTLPPLTGLFINPTVGL
jgi:hypothetical protein